MVMNQANLFILITQDNITLRRLCLRVNKYNVPLFYVRLEREAPDEETFNVFIAVIR